jgi:hypothetical protein
MISGLLGRSLHSVRNPTRSKLRSAIAANSALVPDRLADAINLGLSGVVVSPGRARIVSLHGKICVHQGLPRVDPRIAGPVRRRRYRFGSDYTVEDGGGQGAESSD